MRLTLFIIFVGTTFCLNAQEDDIFSRFSFEGDFRFRVEQDWNSKKSDGTFRDDRSRMRYRVRAGLTYQHNTWASAGLRLRTGLTNKQQDPQLTLGAASEEFGTLPIGLEKAYFQGQWSTFHFWLGKNTFPFAKSNELFWSDNVFPEGIFISKQIPIKEGKSKIDVNLGHFIITSRNESFIDDSYVQGCQLNTDLFNNKISFFPGIFFFNNIPDIPDGGETYFLDYSILHLGSRARILKDIPLRLDLDYYYNLENYDQNENVPENLRNQRSGVVVAVNYGNLNTSGNWFFSATYNYQERFAAVDFLAQNDWARWDYSAFDSPDGRLTNYQGIELVAAYALAEKITLKTKFYIVEQLVAYGIRKETGTRIRFDIDIKL